MNISPALPRRASATAPANGSPAPTATADSQPKESFSLGRSAAEGVLTFMGRRIPTTVPEISEARRAELKSLIKPGDVILTADCAYPGWARMEFWTVRSDHTHAAYYAGEGKVYEAVGAGVVETTLDKAFEGRLKVAIVRAGDLSEEDVQAANAFCRSHLGKSYDSVFNTGDENEFYCSELVSKALQAMPHPIEAPTREILGKTAVAPDAFLHIPGAKVVYTDNSGYWSNKLGHWPLALATVGAGVAGGLAGGVAGAVAGTATGLIGSILVGNKIQTGHWSPSLVELREGKH